MPSPNQENQNPDQFIDLDDPTPNPDSPTPNPDPVPQPDPTPVNAPPDPRVLELIREANARARQAEENSNRMADALRQATAPVPQAPPPISSEEFINDPAAAIRREVGAINAPLLEFVASQKRNQQLGYLKNQYFAQNTNLAPYAAQLYVAIDEYIDPNRDPSLMDIDRAVKMLVGNLILNSPQLMTNAPMNPAPTPTPQPNTPPVTVPPTIRNAPAAPRNDPKPQARQLSQNEKAMANMWGMTDEQYLAELDGDDTMIINTRGR